MRTLLFLVFCCVLGAVASESAIEPVDCTAKMLIDQALITYEIDDGSTLQLFATNSQCYKCVKSIVATSNGQCALLFTPHEWSLYIVDSTTNHVVAQRDYTFGEHGKYTISLSSSNKIRISEDKEPTDSMAPLNTLIIIICVIVFLAYVPSIGNYSP